MSRADSFSLRILIAMLFLAGHGCSLFPDAQNNPSNTLTLQRIAPTLDQIELEVWYVDRPVGDPLIGDALWNEIDQISTIDVEDRVDLNIAGIRYGVASSNLPETLGALLRDREGSAVQRTTRQQIPLTSGKSAELEVVNLPQPCRIRVSGRPSQETRDYSGVRCVFQVTARRIQEGWVRLEFVPEIHHGDPRIRPLATGAGTDWQFQESQQIEPLYEQRFSVELNLGEHVLIGPVGEAVDSVGQHFFRFGKADPGQERLIVIRVQGMERINPVPTRDWSLLP